jgi:hypothetical protein
MIQMIFKLCLDLIDFSVVILDPAMVAIGHLSNDELRTLNSSKIDTARASLCKLFLKCVWQIETSCLVVATHDTSLATSI